MTEEKKSSFKKTWDILQPFIIYFVVHDLAQVLLAFLMNLSLGAFKGAYAEFIIRNASSVNGVLNAVSLLIGMASVWPMARRELVRAEEKPDKLSKEKGRQIAEYLPLITFSVSLALGVNILLTLIGLTGSSETYNEIAVKQYGVAFGVGVIVYGILSPLAEEIVFRGLIYNRMKRYFNKVMSIVVCGILFGVYHGNLVQGIYGCILGVAITFSYELYGSFLVPVLFHSMANLCVFIAGYNQKIFINISTLTYCVIFLTISLISLFFMVKMKKNQYI